jgi:hypothetical protein
MAVALGALGALSSLSPAVAQAPSQAELARGKYVFGATGGCGCHTKPKEPVNAGGRRYDGPFGTVYATNITPDRETGIGGWTDEQIVTAVRLGRRPNGDRILPVHPYTVFNGMAAEDLRALTAYLRTIPAVKRANAPKRITVPLFESVFLPAWLAAFAPKETPPPSAPATGVPRGEYLVRRRTARASSPARPRGPRTRSSRTSRRTRRRASPGRSSRSPNTSPPATSRTATSPAA